VDFDNKKLDIFLGFNKFRLMIIIDLKHFVYPEIHTIEDVLYQVHKNITITYDAYELTYFNMNIADKDVGYNFSNLDILSIELISDNLIIEKNILESSLNKLVLTPS
jgi:hypothetical protein